MQRVLWVASALLLVPVAAGQPVFDPTETIQQVTDDLIDRPPGELGDNQQLERVWDLLDPQQPEEGGEAPQQAPDKEAPSFADRVATAFQEEAMMWGAGSAALVVLSLGGFALVTRYISPKEALKNPQRSMLYGFVRGNPGAHLKQLSEEFNMKTSSILWHIRKLESADLVKSERVGGYRVFYAVEGGIEIKRVSRAMTALQNDNARHIFSHVQANPGATTRQISERLSIHGGTARWHLRKLRDAGLMDELVQESGSRFFNTPLGDRALETMEGKPTVPAPRRTPTAVPTD